MSSEGNDASTGNREGLKHKHRDANNNNNKNNNNGAGGEKDGGGNKEKAKQKPHGKESTGEKNPTAKKKISEEVFLVLSFSVSGRSPANGWIMGLGATAITASSRRLVGVFERNLLPLTASTVAPLPGSIVGYWKQNRRAELEYLYRDQVTPEKAFQDLIDFCAPFKQCTLVGSPLQSMYGWLSFYWSVLRGTEEVMPWGFSGLCARSYASGLLHVSTRSLTKNAAYKAASEGYESTGIPLSESLVSAVLFTHLYLRYGTSDDARDAGVGDGEGKASSTTETAAAPEVKPLTIECSIPETSLSAGALEKLVLCDAVRSGLDPEWQEKNLTSFTEYPSITDLSYSPRFTTYMPQELQSCEWVATEKVHGSNFTIFTDGVIIWAAKRTSYLTLKDSSVFFQYQYMLSTLADCTMRAHAAVASAIKGEMDESTVTTENGVVVALVGEFAGGMYDHSEVACDLRGTQVQRGVQYSPQNFFYGYDVAYLQRRTDASNNGDTPSETPQEGAPTTKTETTTTTTQANQATLKFLPFELAMTVYGDAGFPCHTKALHRGSLTEMLALSPIFHTTIPGDTFHLPPLQGNEAEGFVIRPLSDASIQVPSNNTSAEDPKTMRTRRAIIKRKHPKFCEFAKKGKNAFSEVPGDGEENGDEADAGEGMTAPDPNEGTGADVSPLDRLKEMLNEARVESVLSKYTEREQEDHQRMVMEVLKDALEDAKSLYGDSSAVKK